MFIVPSPEPQGIEYEIINAFGVLWGYLVLPGESGSLHIFVALAQIPPSPLV